MIDVARAFGLLMFSYLIIFFVNFVFLSKIGLADNYKVLERVRTFDMLIVFLAIFVAPVVEEFFFRGLLLNLIGVVPSAFIFGLSHFAYGSYSQIINGTVLGLVLGYTVKHYNINVCIYYHILLNTITIALVYALNGTFLIINM